MAYRLFRDSGSTTLLVAPTLDQARLLFDRLLDLVTRLHERWPDRFDQAKVRTGSFPRLDLGTNRVLARSGHRPRSLRGQGADHIVADEAAYLAKGLLGEVLYPMLATAKKSTITLLSTPSGFGEFQKFFERGLRQEPSHWSRTAPTAENPQVSSAFIELMRQTVSEATFAREYEGRFAGIEGGIFAFDSLKRAVEVAPFLAGHGPFVAGLDLARTRDWTALAIIEGSCDGARLVEIERWRGIGWERQLEKVRGILANFPGVSLRIDGTGVGDAVVEWARKMLPGLAIRTSIFTPDHKRQLIEGLAVRIEAGKLALPDHRELIDELLSFVLKPNGRLEGSGAHDDLVCALAMAAIDIPIVNGLPIQVAGRLV